MKYITNNYQDITLKNNYTTSMSPLSELLVKPYENLAKIFNNRYSPLYIYNLSTESDKYNEFMSFIKNTYSSPILYNPISLSFVPDYAFIYDISELINNQSNLLLFNTGVNISEALLYYYTQISKFNQITYYIHNLYNINKGDISEYDKSFIQLKKSYDGEKIIIDNGLENDISVGVGVGVGDIDKINRIIKKYKDNKIDMIFLDYRKTNKLIKIDSFESIDLIVIYIMFQVLQKGGKFIFNLHNYSKNFTKNILVLLSKYFEKIIIHSKKIKDIDKDYYFICLNYKGLLNNDDNDILINIIKNLNTYITSLFSYEENTLDKFVDSLYVHIVNNQKKAYKINKKYTKNINNLTTNDLINIYNKKNETNSNNILYISMIYNIPLKEEYLKRAKLELNIMTKLLAFEPPFHIALNNYLEKNTDPNNLITINNNSINLSKLDSIKETLNLYKMGIDTRNPEKWENIVYNLNISQQVMKNIKNTHNITITRAFAKMYEILFTYKSMLFTNKNLINTMHICEAPGHFINATVYFIKSNFPNMEHKWVANSLNPTNKENLKKYGSLFKDEYGFIRKYPDRWLWGADDTGDITKPINIDFFKKNYEHKIDLFSSDCGLGSNLRYEFFTQEDWMSILNFSHIFISLITLKLGGSAIYKFFVPFSKQLSVALLYVLSIFFEHVYINKPTTSSPTNNEIYMIAINKKYNLSDTNYNKFIDFIKDFNNNKNLFTNNEKYKLFVDQVYSASKLMVDQQIEQLNVIYKFYDKPESLKENQKLIWDAKDKFANNWLNYFNFKNINKNFFIT